VPQTVYVALLVFSFLGAGSIWSVSAAKGTKPGDSLYVAKIVSEKAKLAVTFNEKEETKLRLSFATNRAEEINKVLDESASDKKDETVSGLVSDMKNEIEAVKTKISKMNTVAKAPVKEEKKVAVKKEDKKENVVSTTEVNQEGGGVEEDDSQIISANSGKEVKGISTSDQNKKEIEVKVEKVAPAETAKELLDKAKESLKNEDYNSTIGLLDKISTAVGKEIKSNDKGEVKGESATSTR